METDGDNAQGTARCPSASVLQWPWMHQGLWRICPRAREQSNLSEERRAMSIKSARDGAAARMAYLGVMQHPQGLVTLASVGSQ